MNSKTILMPKVILAKFLSQKSYSSLTFLTWVRFSLVSLVSLVNFAIARGLGVYSVIALFLKSVISYFSDFTMTTNLVNMDLSQEVNNNNQDKSEDVLMTSSFCSTASPESAISSLTCSEDLVKETEEISNGIEQPNVTYTLNQNFQIKVNSPEEWLCVARMPVDFTQTEFQTLLKDFGKIQQCFLIHSEITGKQTFWKIVWKLRTQSHWKMHIFDNEHVLRKQC